MCRVLIPLLALPLLAQAPAKGTKAFFMQDPKVVMAACVEESMALSPNRDHGATNAEWGRALLAAGQREKAEGLFERAAVTGGRGSGTGLLVSLSSGISVPSSSMLQLIGCSWLRTGHAKEALAAFESMARLNPEEEDGFLKAGQDLLRAGMVVESSAMMRAYQNLKPHKAGDFLDYAEVASALGYKDLTQQWCQAAAVANPTDARDVAKAGRLLAEGLGAVAPARAPWAPDLPGAASHTPGKIWVLSTFEVTLSRELGNLGSATGTFQSMYPDRDAFIQAKVKRLLTALPEAGLLPGTHSVATLPSMAQDGALALAPEDLILGITKLDIREEQAGYYPRTDYFRTARLGLGLFDRTGKLIASHTFVTIMPRIFKMEKGLEFTFDQMAAFLKGPTFARWRE